MKRLSILFASILLFSISSFASDEYNVLWSLNKEATFNKVTHYVKANQEQSHQMSQIFYASTERLQEALADNDQEAAQKALYFNIANVKSILSAKQYRKYLEILNATYNQQLDSFLSMTSK